MFSTTEFSSNFSAKGKITDRQSHALFFFEEELKHIFKKVGCCKSKLVYNTIGQICTSPWKAFINVLMKKCDNFVIMLLLV